VCHGTLLRVGREGNGMCVYLDGAASSISLKAAKSNAMASLAGLQSRYQHCLCNACSCSLTAPSSWFLCRVRAVIDVTPSRDRALRRQVARPDRKCSIAREKRPERPESRV